VCPPGLHAPRPAVKVTKSFSTSFLGGGGELTLPPGPSWGPSLGSHLSGLAQVHAGGNFSEYGALAPEKVGCLAVLGSLGEQAVLELDRKPPGQPLRFESSDLAPGHWGKLGLCLWVQESPPTPAAHFGHTREGREGRGPRLAQLVWSSSLGHAVSRCLPRMAWPLVVHCRTHSGHRDPKLTLSGKGDGVVPEGPSHPR